MVAKCAALATLMLDVRSGLLPLPGLLMLTVFGAAFVAPNAAVMVRLPRVAGVAAAGPGALPMAGGASAVAVAGLFYSRRLDEIVAPQSSLAIGTAVIFARVTAQPGDDDFAEQAT